MVAVRGSRGHCGSESIAQVMCDDRKLGSTAGLTLVMHLAAGAGLHRLLGQWLSVPTAGESVESTCLVTAWWPARTPSAALDVLRQRWDAGGVFTAMQHQRPPSLGYAQHEGVHRTGLTPESAASG